MKMHEVYILQSQKKLRFYIGVTGDIEQRLKKHNSGSSKSTKPYRPWVVVYTEAFSDKSEAFKREYYLKQPEGYKEKRNIIKENQLDLEYEDR